MGRGLKMFKIIKTKKIEEMEMALAVANKKIKAHQDELEEARTILDIRVKAKTRQLQELTKNLEDKVKERTKELQDRLNELERFHRLTIGRELKMIELKKEIKKSKEK